MQKKSAMESELSLVPPPGHDAAIDLGCECPVMDNEHGRGYFGGPGERFGWVRSMDCPVHPYGSVWATFSEWEAAHA